MPNALPRPARLKRGRSVGVEMISISRMPAIISTRADIDHRLVIDRKQLLGTATSPDRAAAAAAARTMPFMPLLRIACLTLVIMSFLRSVASSSMNERYGSHNLRDA